jgi:hypothetical protein
MRGLRGAAWATSFLIGFVALSAEYEGVFLDPLIVRVKLEPIFRPAGSAEGVSVVDFAIYKEPDTLVFDRLLKHVEYGSGHHDGRCSFLRWPDVGDVSAFLSEIIERWFTHNGKHRLASVFEIVGRSFSKILVGDADIGLPFFIGVKDFDVFNANIGPQLSLCRLVRISDEPNGRQPKHPGNDTQQPFAGFDPQYRSLGSVLASMLAILLASTFYWRGWCAMGGILAAYGIFGLLLRVDLWSLAVRIM